MAAIAWSDVVDFAAELSTFDTEGQTVILAYVNGVPDPANFGGESAATLKLVRIALAAHIATLSKQGASGGAGPVTSETAGALSRSYGAIQGADALLDATPYGRLYRELLNRSPARAPLVL